MAAHAFQPSNGDTVVTQDPDERASWVVSAFPGLAQLRYRSVDAAIDAATRYAAHAGVQVWLADPWRLHVLDATERPCAPWAVRQAHDTTAVHPPSRERRCVTRLTGRTLPGNAASLVSSGP